MISKGLETAATVTAIYVFYVVRQTIVIIFLGSFGLYLCIRFKLKKNYIIILEDQVSL